MYVNVENVNFAYDKKPILHNINFGSSFAVEIARKIGLPEEVIADFGRIRFTLRIS